MKKYYSLFIVMVLGLLGFAASARPVEITVEGNGTVLWGFWGDVTHELQPGVNSFDWVGYYYFTNQEGTEIVSFVNNTYDTPSDVSKDPYNPDYYAINVADRTTPMKFTVVTKADEPEEGVSFTLENGSASIYLPGGRDANGNQTAPEKVKDLTIGENMLPLVNGKMYVIVAGEGLTMTVTNTVTGGDVYVNDAQYGNYGGYFAQVNGWQVGSYTITTSPAPVKKDSYDVTFNIIGGNAITLTHRDYSNGFPPVVETQTVTNGQTLNFKADDSWECTAPEDYELLSVVNAEGEPQQIITFSTPHYFQLNTYDVPSESYTFELKSTKVEGVTFNLTNGTASIYLPGGRDANGNQTAPEKVQDLTIGENILPLANGKMYVIVAGEGLTMTVKNDADGSDVYVNDAQYGNYGGYFAQVNGWQVGSYTITTSPAPVKKDSYDVTFNIIGGNAITLTHRDYSNGFPPVVETQTVTNGQTLNFKADDSWECTAPEDYELLSVVNAEGEPQQIITFSTPHYFQLNTYDVPSESYTFELKSTKVEGVTFNLTNGTASIYLPGGRDANGNKLDPEKVQDLTVGETTLPLVVGKMYVIVAGEGLTMTVKNDADGQEVYVNDAQYGDYGGYFAQVNGWQVGSYTITTKPAPVKKDSYDVTFNITGGDAITLTHRDYSNGFPPVVETQTVTNGQTLTFKADDSWECSAPAGYELLSVLNAEGEPQQIITFSNPPYFQLNTYDVPSDSYTFELRVDTPVEEMFIVNVDNASRVSMSNADYQTITLTNGTNLLEPGIAYSFSYTGGVPFVSVTLNGEPLANEYGFYRLSAEQTAAGNVLDIVANYPDVDYTYTFVYPKDGPVWNKAYWEDSNYDLHEIPIVDNSITVKAGSSVVLYAIDPDNWTDVTITLPDGSTTMWMNYPTYPGEDPMYNANFFATMPSGDIVTEATAFTQIVYTDVTVNVDGDASLLTASYGNVSSPNPFTSIASLRTGANTVTIPEGNSIRFSTKNGGTIETVTFKADADAQQADVIADAMDGTFLAGPFGQGGEVTVTMAEPETPKVNFDLTVNDPSAIVIRYYNSRNQLVKLDCELTEGVNHLSVPKDENYSFVQLQISGVSAANDIKSIRYRKSADFAWSNATLSGNNDYCVYIYADYQNEVEVEVNKLDIDKSCTVFTDFGVNHGVKLVSAQGREVNLNAGYQTFEFGDSENPFTVKASNANVTPVIFVDGEKIDGTSVTLTEGALVKIFTGSVEPLTFGFEFVAKNDECDEISVANVMLDGRTEVTDLSAPLELLYGTEVSFSIVAPEDVTYTVKMGDDDVTANSEGIYTVWPRENGNVVITYNYTAPVELRFFIVGEFTNNEMLDDYELVEDAMGYTAVGLPVISGEFFIKSNTGELTFGSNGNPVVLNTPYAFAENAEKGMVLAVGEVTDANVTLNPADMTITVTGTVGINALTVDQLDHNALYFDLQGRQIKAENIVHGFYIQVANGVVSKIAVK